MFRPCIDLHEGRVKQIVGGTLRDAGPGPTVNFEASHSAGWYADLYKKDGLRGGHVIMLGPGNEAAAREALAAYPGGLQVGGGIHDGNAAQWLAAGASHVIVTSHVFRDGKIDWERLRRLCEAVSREKIVLDLSCRQKDGRYWIVTNRWQRFTEVRLDARVLEKLADYAAEYLIHAADVEGLQRGVDWDMVRLLAESSPLPAVYAGGANRLEDLRQIAEIGRGRIGLTIGSALDIFGGPLAYRAVVELDRALRIQYAF